ncbi:MAG: Dtdp-4-dehydrorhamnose reductase [Parcubacteria group bacterium GW2011_GWF2_39_8b]|nr:MAG: Dtdp-4-dehydrorhamnose reductase [Parcubacteria group bacterium GW2011_GWF2_39_8b]
MINKSDRVAITGCGGMLGEAVHEVFTDICHVYASDIDVNVAWLDRLDVSSSKDVAKYLAKVKPNYIIHLAALTDMEYCELHPEEAYATNTDGVRNVADYAREHNLPLLYISTAGIFDGEKDEYNEKDIPNPLSVYGKSKYAGELIARDLPKSVVIRAGWMMGGGPKKDKKFVNKIIKQLQVGIRELNVVTDKYGTPCYTHDLAKSIKYILEHELYGRIYHGACQGNCSRYDVAVAIVKYFKLSNKIKVRKVTSDFVKETWFAPRPRSEVLTNIELKKIAPHLTRDWKVCLKEYLREFTKEIN